jgi:hypothetical protein
MIVKDHNLQRLSGDSQTFNEQVADMVKVAAAQEDERCGDAWYVRGKVTHRRGGGAESDRLLPMPERDYINAGKTVDGAVEIEHKRPGHW